MGDPVQGPSAAGTVYAVPPVVVGGLDATGAVRALLVDTTGKQISTGVSVATLTINPVQNAATYTAGTVSGGDILVLSATAYVGTAVTGLTSIAIKTNNTANVTLLTATNQASLTADLTLTPYTTRLYLASGKLIQYVIVGNGTAGTMKLVVEYQSLTAGATIS